MNKQILIILVSAIFILMGCAANRFAKKGLEFEQVGYYEKAADMYYMSLTKNINHVDATIGLKRSGQKNLDNTLDQFMQLYQADEHKDAVYKYVESLTFYEKVKNVGVELNFPTTYKEYYKEVKEIYLNKIYDEAYLLLEEEQFSKAELKFNEILKLDPNYGDVDELKRKAHYEPIYRKGKQQLLNEKYRSAYRSFKEIIDALTNYKDARELMNESLKNAIITIAVADFNNLTRYTNIQKQLESTVEAELNKLNSPFIKIVDRDNNEQITSEQLLTLEGKVDETISSKAGKMLGVKAIITAEVQEYYENEGSLKKEEKKGYLKEVKTIKKGEEEIEKTIYHKTKYYEYKQSHKVVCRIQFKLISTETSEILVNDAFTVAADDEIHYITFNGNGKNLVRGNWVSLKKDSPKDEVVDNNHSNKELQRLLKANKRIKSIEILKSEVLGDISKKVAKKIYNYDPES